MTSLASEPLNLDKALEVFSDPQLSDYARYAVQQAGNGHTYDLEILAALKRYPVSVEEFVLNTKYLGLGDSIYPKVLETLVELNNPGVDGLSHGIRVGSIFSEAVLTGAIGVAKSTIAILSTAYQVYILSCMRNSQALFGIDPSSEILFVFQSINAALAKQVDFDRFKALVEGSPYFRSYFPFDKNIKSELRFPNRIIVRPVSGLETATIGMNVFGGVLDEVNFMEVVQRSKRSIDGDTYDQAVALYNSVARRRKSRFLKQGRLPGLLCLVSSKRYPGQFTDQKVAEAKRQLHETGRSTIYVYDKTTWDIKPDAFCGEHFPVYAGDATHQPRILSQHDPVPKGQDELIVNVPVEYRSEFETDLMKALRDIAGRSTMALHPFILDMERVHACFGKRQGILSSFETDFRDIPLKIYPNRIEAPKEPRFVHVDLALTRDSAGLAIGYVPRFTAVKRGDTVEQLPVIAIDATLEIQPPKGGEIPFWKIREMLYKLRDLGMTIRWVSFDGYQSADSIQLLRQKGFVTGLQSMDKTFVPYEFMKMALYDSRVEAPYHPKLLAELQSLEVDTKTGKIDHQPNGSKDTADSLAGVVYGLTMRRETWVRHEIPTSHVPDSIRTLLTNDDNQAA